MQEIYFALCGQTGDDYANMIHLMVALQVKLFIQDSDFLELLDREYTRLISKWGNDRD
jgi:hypothetical protein